MHLKEYIDARSDHNSALFVTLDAPYNRLKISGVEIRLRQLGRKLDSEMMHKWYEFVGKEALTNPRKDYRHLNNIIKEEGFIRKYVSCDKHNIEFWIFVLCDGEVGYFDGYSFKDSFPQGLAELLDIEKYFGGSFELVDGSWRFVHN